MKQNYVCNFQLHKSHLGGTNNFWGTSPPPPQEPSWRRHCFELALSAVTSTVYQYVHAVGIPQNCYTITTRATLHMPAHASQVSNTGPPIRVLVARS